MTIFPDEFEIRVIDKKKKQPIENIVLMIHIFANHKNDYYLTSNRSNKDGIICVTKQMLEDEIDTCRNMFIMDFSSTLNDCKPYIEIKAEENAEIEKRIKGIEKCWMHDDVGKKNYNHLKGCENALILGKSKIIMLEQGVKKQKILFEVSIIDNDFN